MKKILALFLLTAGCLCAQELNLGSHGKITLYLNDDWKFSVMDYGENLTLTVTSKGDVNANCKLVVTYPEEDRLDTKARLRLKVEALGMQFAEQSAEGKAVAKEFSLQTGSGYGFYCNFTDPELVGKPPVKDNFKTLSAGLIHVAPDVLIEVGISADGFKSEAYQLLLGMIEGMEFTPPKPARR